MPAFILNHIRRLERVQTEHSYFCGHRTAGHFHCLGTTFSRFQVNLKLFSFFLSHFDVNVTFPFRERQRDRTVLHSLRNGTLIVPSCIWTVPKWEHGRSSGVPSCHLRCLVLSSFPSVDQTSICRQCSQLLLEHCPLLSPIMRPPNMSSRVINWIPWLPCLVASTFQSTRTALTVSSGRGQSSNCQRASLLCRRPCFDCARRHGRLMHDHDWTTVTCHSLPYFPNPSYCGNLICTPFKEGKGCPIASAPWLG